MNYSQTPRSCRVYCTLCGREIGLGEPYWTVNGTVICEDCLPSFARRDYQPCQTVRGEEARP